jgi:hypothetical protein
MALRLRLVLAGDVAERIGDQADTRWYLALDDDLGVGRDQKVVAPRLRRHEAQWLAEVPADGGVVVRVVRRQTHGAEVEGRMVAEDGDDRHRQVAVLVVGEGPLGVR